MKNLVLPLLAILLSGITSCASNDKKESNDSNGNQLLNSSRKDDSGVWVADNGDGTYRNPIIHADYSDPDICKVGDDFYMTASSFNCIPGLPILHSKDLVNWTILAKSSSRPRTELCRLQQWYYTL